MLKGKGGGGGASGGGGRGGGTVGSVCVCVDKPIRVVACDLRSEGLGVTRSGTGTKPNSGQ